jgi:hypothetical protein
MRLSNFAAVERCGCRFAAAAKLTVLLSFSTAIDTRDR